MITDSMSEFIDSLICDEFQVETNAALAAFRKLFHPVDQFFVRYADDIVMGFEHRAEAERFLQDWRERLGKFGLELHPDKTRLIEFGRFAAEDRKRRGEGKPETFNFLGFTHICAKNRKPVASRSIARLYISDSQQNSKQ